MIKFCAPVKFPVPEFPPIITELAEEPTFADLPTTTELVLGYAAEAEVPITVQLSVP